MRQCQSQVAIFSILAALILASLFIATSLAVAAPPVPRDMPLLSITRAGSDISHQLTLADLEALPQRTVTGLIPDVGDTLAQWTGASLAELLDTRDEPLPGRLTASALDHYYEILPGDDLTRFDPIVAYLRNGDYLSINERGPLVIMYDHTQLPRGQERPYYNRTVWQLTGIHLE